METYGLSSLFDAALLTKDLTPGLRNLRVQWLRFLRKSLAVAFIGVLFSVSISGTAAANCLTLLNYFSKEDSKTTKLIEEWRQFYQARLEQGEPIEGIPLSKVDRPEKLYALTLALFRTELSSDLIEPKSHMSHSLFSRRKRRIMAEKAFTRSFSPLFFMQNEILDRDVPLDKFADAILGAYGATHIAHGHALWKTGVRERVDRQFLISYAVPKLAQRLTELGVFKFTPEEVERFKKTSYRKILTRELIKEIPMMIRAGTLMAVGGFHGLPLLALAPISDFTNYLPVASAVMDFIKRGDLEGARQAANHGTAPLIHKVIGVGNAVRSKALMRTIKIGLFGAMLFKAYPYIELGYSVVASTPHDVITNYNENLDANAAREEQFKEHVQDIIENENRTPTQAELDNYRKKLQAMRDSDFYLVEK